MPRNDVLAVDIGNTRISAALVRNGRVLRRLDLDQAPMTVAVAVKALRRLVAGVSHMDAALATVVPSQRKVWRKALAEVAGRLPAVVDHRSNAGFLWKYPARATLGADRIADLAGAVARCGYPVIVADVGTAVTVDGVDSRGYYRGGAIAPGPGMMAKALAEHTAQLPLVKTGGAAGLPGRNTEGAIRAGIGIGSRGMLRALVDEMRRLEGFAGAPVLLTGGYAAWLARGLPVKATVVPELTLTGLYRIAIRSRMGDGEGTGHG